LVLVVVNLAIVNLAIISASKGLNILLVVQNYRKLFSIRTAVRSSYFYNC